MRKAVLLLVVVAVVGLPVLAQTPADKAPDVGAEFQEAIDGAWQDAVEGTSSFKACAALKGSLHGRIRSQGDTELAARAAKAIHACEVDVPARYFQTYLDAVVAGEHTCMDFMSHVETEMGGIRTRPTSLEDMEPQEPKPLILKVLAERIRKDCPAVAPFMLRGIGGES
jgi:hypothetical protein